MPDVVRECSSVINVKKGRLSNGSWILFATLMG
jgi:hypothetical protein